VDVSHVDFEDPENFRDRAIHALVDRDPRAAADHYTRAAHAALAGLEGETTGRDTLAPDERGWVGYGLKYLLLAGLASRAAGDDDRAGTRCREGVLVAKDLREHVLTDPVQQGCLREYAADLGIVGGFAEPEAYDAVRTAYERAVEAGDVDQTSWVTTPLFQSAYESIHQAARNASTGFEWDDLHGSNPEQYLVHRARFKRSRVPAAVEQVVADRLHPPRGTTEHNSDDFRCPACGTNEVNWTAGVVICLDCSTPMERERA
jgi:hypothetical protein